MAGNVGVEELWTENLTMNLIAMYVRGHFPTPKLGMAKTIVETLWTHNSTMILVVVHVKLISRRQDSASQYGMAGHACGELAITRLDGDFCCVVCNRHYPTPK